MANTTIIENGTPHITTEVWSAVRPPLYKSTAAIMPSNIAHVTLERIGESSWMPKWLFDESIDATSAPESDEVTKNVTIIVKAKIEINVGIG